MRHFIETAPRFSDTLALGVHRHRRTICQTLSVDLERRRNRAGGEIGQDATTQALHAVEAADDSKGAQSMFINILRPLCAGGKRLPIEDEREISLGDRVLV